jgi:hypothetical protein
MSNTVVPMSVKDRIKGARRQRRSFRINLRGDLVAEVERLEAELEDAVEADRAPNANRRLGQKKSPLVSLAEKIDAIRDAMGAEWLELELEARPWAEWRDFKNANPARDESHVLDQNAGLNFDALTEEFTPRCVVSPALDDEDWQGLFDKCAPGDLRNLAGVVFSLHEAGLDVPKSPTASAVRTRNAADSVPLDLGE